MTIILVLFTLLSAPSSEDIWQLRAGVPTPSHPSVPGGSAYLMAVLGLSGTMTHAEVRAGVVAGHTSLVVPLAAGLVSRGETWAAELYWNSTEDPPAIRSELLAALAWYGRFHLYPVMASSPAVPADMEGKLHSDHCAAICAIGWMSPRENGLFQGEDLISPGDLRRLSGFFPGVDPAGGSIGVSRLDLLFRNEGGSGER